MPFRILSLSGGGARGIYQAVFLARLAERLGGSLSKSFDLIAGTSTGAIVGAAAAFDVDLAKVVELFRKDAPKIFDKKFAAGIRKGPRYASTPLLDALTHVFEDKKLGNAKTRLLITSASLDRFGHHLFTDDGDPDTSAVDAIACSAAAPTFFAPVKPGDSERTFVDGGMWANTPSLAAVLHAHTKYGVPFDDMYLVSLGNGFFPQGTTADRLESARPYGPFAILSMFELMFSAQGTSADALAASLLGSDHVLTINDPLPAPIELDDANAANRQLPALAEGAVAAHAPKILEWYLREEEEHITLTRATSEEAARFPGAGDVYRCNVRTERRGGIWKNEITILFALEEFAPKSSPDLFHYLGRGDLDDKAYEAFCDGLTPERVSQYIVVNEVRATLLNGRTVDFVALPIVCEKGMFELRYRLPEPVEDALAIHVSLDSFFDAQAGWYLYVTDRPITRKVTVSFTAPFKTEGQQTIRDGLNFDYANQRVAKTYCTQLTAAGPIPAGSEVRWDFTKEDS